MKQAYLARHIISLVQGKFDQLNLEYVREHMECTKGVRYVEIQMEEIFDEEKTSDQEMRVAQRKLYHLCMEYLKEDADLCVFDVSVNEKSMMFVFYILTVLQRKQGCQNRII